MLIEIKSKRNDKILHIVETDSLKMAVEMLVKQGADLGGADLGGADLRDANLRGAYLRGAEIEDLICLSELSDAISIAPLIWNEWQENGISSAQNKFGLYRVGGEDKALIAMCPRLIGGFCFVLGRREIWMWNWSCPKPETVPVLWRESGYK